MSHQISNAQPKVTEWDIFGSSGSNSFSIGTSSSLLGTIDKVENVIRIPQMASSSSSSAPFPGARAVSPFPFSLFVEPTTSSSVDISTSNSASSSSSSALFNAPIPVAFATQQPSSVEIGQSPKVSRHSSSHSSSSSRKRITPKKLSERAEHVRAQNRLYAARSRQKKQSLLEKSECKVQSLVSENETLKMQNRSLQEQNETLRREVQTLTQKVADQDKIIRNLNLLLI